MAFAYEITADPSIDPSLVKDADYALSQWSDALDGKGTLNVALQWNSSLPVARADTDVTAVPTSIEAGRTVTISSAVYELTSGQHAASLPDNSGADAVINLDPGYVQNYLYADPDPSPSSAVPTGKIDAVSVFEHEIGHALGIDGYYPLNADSTSALGAFESSYDRFVAFQDGAPVFTGPHAEATNNEQPVPLTQFPASDPESSQNIYHLGTTADGAFGSDLMTGAPYQEGVRYTISATDIGIVEDVTGLQPAGQSTEPVAAASDLCDLSQYPNWQHHRMAFMHGGDQPDAAHNAGARPASAGMGPADFGKNHTPAAPGGAAASDPRVSAWAGAMHWPGDTGHPLTLPQNGHSA